MRRTLATLAVTAIGTGAIALAACTSRAAPTGVTIPFPEEGSQYRLSELCQHLQTQNYDVRGTLTHTLDAEDLGGVLDNLPALARRPVENYLQDGVRVEFEITGLCHTLNR